MKVLVLSSFTKSLLWFRIDFMDELVEAGHEVVALGSDDDDSYQAEFRRHGITYRSFSVSRNGLSPLEDMRTYAKLRRIIKEISPDKIFVYQAKTIVYGCPAARAAGVGEVYPVVAGLGSVFRSGGLKNRLIQAVLRVQYKRAFRLSKKVFFQNEDDIGAFVSMGLLPADKIVRINGSGVSLERFTAEPLPEAAVFLFVGRLIKDKGIIEYLEACAEIKRRHPDTRCLLVGPYDTNPSALSPSELEPYMAAGVVEYHGEQTDVRSFIAQSSVFVLPSYHEGTPKSVLEAMAMGRPIITTNVPGCRETVTPGVNGFLVEPKSVRALVDHMEFFIEDAALITRMGGESRRIAEKKYDVHEVNKVIRQTMGLAET